jgi:tetratricopeptide (TPR) repeat protein
VPEYHYRRAAEYEEESYPYRNVIELYKQKLEDSHILFPEIGLDCLERLGRLSQVGFVLLTADKGDHRMENWEFAEPPKLIHHGSFSLTANYHAIQHIFEQKGALSYFTEHHYKNLNVGCIIMLVQPASYANTRLAYRRFVERFGPDDFFSMKLWFDEHLESLELYSILAFWRLSRYDAQLFIQSAQRIQFLLPESSDEEAEDLRQGIQMMWAGYYPMNEQHHLALDCGNLLYELELYEEARMYFERSLEDGTITVEAFYKLSVCCYEEGDETEASEYAHRVLTLEPEHEEAKALLTVFK